MFGIIAVLGTGVSFVLLWPQAVGLHDQWVVAQVIAMRGWLAVGGTGLALGAGTLAAAARKRSGWRTFTVLVALAGLAIGTGNTGILLVRGVAVGNTTAATGPNSVTVLSWNTRGDAPDVSNIVALATQQNADVITLPETTEAYGEQIAVGLRAIGRPMWVYSIAFDHYAKARSTTLLIRTTLGRYTIHSESWRGPPANTNTLPTVVADPVSGDGPRIIAVHAVAPVRWELRNWRSDLDWLGKQCAGPNVIMAGDFNSTLDQWAGRGQQGGDIGACHDAASAASQAGIGTWPTNLPPWFGTPIDHVTATAQWRTTRFVVIQNQDDAGSDHRPVVATLTRT